MRFGQIIRAAVIVLAAFMLVASASASTITFNTNSASTGFVSTSGGTIINGKLELESNSGLVATLTFTPNASSTLSPNPITNANYGDFLLVCSSCVSATFGAFTFDLVIDDVTNNNAIGMFVGTSNGGTVTPTSSNISISWLPVQIGPGASGASSGNFGTTYFQISTPTLIVAPTSGTPPGDTTVQGILGDAAVPEPATMALAGGLLIGLAALARKRRS